MTGTQSIRTKLGGDYVVAFGLASSSPPWLAGIGAKPMYMGLDLRGGVQFLLQVDTDSVETQSLDRLVSELRTAFRDEKIRYRSVRREASIVKVVFLNSEMADLGRAILSDQFSDLDVNVSQVETFEVSLPEEAVKEAMENARVISLSHRVYSLGQFLGIADPVSFIFPDAIGDIPCARQESASTHRILMRTDE